MSSLVVEVKVWLGKPVMTWCGKIQAVVPAACLKRHCAEFNVGSKVYSIECRLVNVKKFADNYNMSVSVFI